MKISPADQDRRSGGLIFDTDDSDAGTVESFLFGSAWRSSWV